MAVVVLQNQENARLLEITNKQLQKKMELLADDDAQLVLLHKAIADNQLIIDNKNQETKELEKALKKERRRHKLTKVLWGTTSAILATLVVLLALK